MEPSTRQYLAQLLMGAGQGITQASQGRPAGMPGPSFAGMLGGASTGIAAQMQRYKQEQLIAENARREQERFDQKLALQQQGLDQTGAYNDARLEDADAKRQATAAYREATSKLAQEKVAEQKRQFGLEHNQRGSIARRKAAALAARNGSGGGVNLGKSRVARGINALVAMARKSREGELTPQDALNYRAIKAALVTQTSSKDPQGNLTTITQDQALVDDLAPVVQELDAAFNRLMTPQGAPQGDPQGAPQGAPQQSVGPEAAAVPFPERTGGAADRDVVYSPKTINAWKSKMGKMKRLHELLYAKDAKYDVGAVGAGQKFIGQYARQFRDLTGANLPDAVTSRNSKEISTLLKHMEIDSIEDVLKESGRFTDKDRQIVKDIIGSLKASDGIDDMRANYQLLVEFIEVRAPEALKQMDF